MKSILWCIETLFALIRITVLHTYAALRYDLAQQQQARLRERLSRKGN